MTTHWHGKWIWSDTNDRQWNYWLCFRREFHANGGPATLRITADSRYRAWLNGQLIGNGPVRAFPETYRYDEYEVHLRPGGNCLAVLAHEFGVGTFQSLPTRGGLLAEICAGDECLVATDPDWKWMEHPTFSRDTARISCQMGWAETYDARLEPHGWHEIAYDDGGWQTAFEIGPVGSPPWSSLHPRDVPFLTEEPIEPASIWRARRVAPPPTVWSVSLRRNLLPGYIEANQMNIEGFLTCVIESDSREVVEMEAIGGVDAGPGRIRLNGREVEAVEPTLPLWTGSRRYRLSLVHGPNLLVWDVSGRYHEWTARAAFDATIGTHGPRHRSAEFATIAISPNDPMAEQIRSSRTVEELEAVTGDLLQPVTALDTHHQVVTDRVAFATEVGALTVDCAFPLTISAGAGDEEIVFDLGKMTVGYWEMDIDAPEGAIIDLLGAEAVQDGILDLPWEMNNTLRYWCREGRQSYRCFNRRGCRYLIATFRDHAEPIVLHGIRTIQATYPVQPIGSFRCDDERLNKIWEMSAYTVRLCMDDTYVDCPTYEQTFWVGDSLTESVANYYAFGAYDISARCLRLAGESLKRSDLVQSQVPSAWTNVIPNWSFMWALAVEDYYRFTGDRATLEELTPPLVMQAENCLKYINLNGLFEIEAWNLTDWAPMDQPNEGVVTPQNLMLGMTWDFVARLTGRSEFAGERKKLFAAINKHLWSEEKQAYVDRLGSETISQQTQILALLSNCAEDERRTTLEKYLIDPPEQIVRVGTPFFTFFQLEALARLGRTDDIVAIIRDKWGIMLDRGATTCWELFPGFMPAGRWTRSHCHAWSAAPAYFLSACILGVRPLEPGFSRAEIDPHPCGLAEAEGSVPTPHGPIHVKWNHSNGKLTLDVSIPNGITAEIRQLDGSSREAGAGDHHFVLA